jgi:hypothetical protein
MFSFGTLERRRTPMVNPKIGGTSSSTRFVELSYLWRLICLLSSSLLFLTMATPVISQAQIQQAKPPGSEPTPEAAIPAILAAFDKYEVVGMPEAHGMKDVDDFILSLIRTPAFSEKVNDIAVECGNALYQPVLDRYIAGEDVPFAEVKKVWRNTTQSMCGTSGFFEQLFPLVRAINQKLPPGKRLRVLAGDPPIDWDQVKTLQDFYKSFPRDTSIASVMEKEVLSKHRKALMLFGTFHLVHGVDESAVSIYEKDYPNLTFVISDLNDFDTDSPALSSSPLAKWPVPSLALAKGTWLGALDLSRFFQPPIQVQGKDCTVLNEFPKNLQKPMAALVDAFLYLGAPALRLTEPMPADIALDVDYRMELNRRDALTGFLGSEWDAERGRPANYEWC